MCPVTDEIRDSAIVRTGRERRRMSARIVVGLLLVFGLIASSASAQSRGLGRVKGSAVDAGGKPVPEVALQTMTADGLIITAKSGGDGTWMLIGLGKGEWMVSFKKPGFADKLVRLIIEKELAVSNPVKITLTKGS
jgi:hypothetical protein